MIFWEAWQRELDKLTKEIYEHEYNRKQPEEHEVLKYRQQGA
jgi:hypothetical protein